MALHNSKEKLENTLNLFALQENNKREVRVEVLGVMDRTSRTFRIRASEPQAGATQQGTRFY